MDYSCRQFLDNLRGKDYMLYYINVFLSILTSSRGPELLDTYLVYKEIFQVVRCLGIF